MTALVLKQVLRREIYLIYKIVGFGYMFLC